LGGFNIDWTINVSNILTILGFAGAGLYAALKAKKRCWEVTRKFAPTWRSRCKLKNQLLIVFRTSRNALVRSPTRPFRSLVKTSV